MTPLLAPSILSADFGRLAEEIREAEAGGAGLVHVYVMDGRFVPNLTVGPLVLRSFRGATRLPFEVHLMIEEPLRTLVQYLDAGGAGGGVHVETEPHLHRFAEHVFEVCTLPALRYFHGELKSLKPSICPFAGSIRTEA